ncbi:SDR family oxidoreductase [Gluconacetobacter sp. 1b LMG 1731]|uniref:SDR family oxidoreductase n=1 Tax=Gluconacetobacter dulcium TaxID=2729096 RepID=A0A7W4IND2_9PROT|nr:SDR family oxidoreductase [Gluconacetobacter dulcium]MBB2166066.1 SDR family oxidoreductase [Gluconacetobacter dulcium]MBB2195202.1 SDR family oxidoreductase [Gluconacetobacter dulcium]
MNLQLEGRAALVMGSSRGLGRACAKALAREGAHVILTGRHEATLQAGCTAIQEEGGSASFRVVDFQDTERAMQHIAGLGDIDIVVTNCGGPPPGPIATVNIADLGRHFDTMVRVPVAVASTFLPGMRQRGFGRIINIVSSGVIQPIANLGLSNMLRPAILGWAKTLAAEVAADGVTVNSVVPGRIHTERVDELDAAAAKRQGRSPEDVARASRENIPMKRYGRPDEFSNAVAFLASDRASYMTGGLIRVDGGLIAAI